MLASLMAVSVGSTRAEPMIDEMVRLLSSDGFTSLTDHALKRRPIESLNEGLRSIDSFAKVHWIDAGDSEHPMGTDDRQNFGIEL